MIDFILLITLVIHIIKSKDNIKALFYKIYNFEKIDEINLTNAFIIIICSPY